LLKTKETKTGHGVFGMNNPVPKAGADQAALLTNKNAHLILNQFRKTDSSPVVRF
jgi:hypothetical protein